MLPKVNAAIMTETMGAIDEILRSCCDVKRVLLAYVIRKNVFMETYGAFLWYTTPDYKMIAMMLQ